MPPLKHFPSSFDCTFVTFNGALGLSKRDADGQRQVLFNRPVCAAVGDRIFDLALEHNYVVNVYVDQTIYACCRTDAHAQLCARYEELTSCTYEYRSDEYRSFRGGEYSKILVLAREGDELDALFALLQARLTAAEAHLVRGNFFVEVLHPAVNKGEGLRGLCAALQVDLGDVVAMGDGDNDAEFLAVAGCGVAMKNGTRMSKEAAKRETQRTNDEDGVAVELRSVFADVLKA